MSHRERSERSQEFDGLSEASFKQQPQREASLERRVLWGLLLGVAIYAGIAIWTDVSSVLEVLRDFAPEVFLGALALSLVNYAVRFAKWQVYLRVLGVEVPTRISLHAFLAGFVMSVTPGKVGEVLKSVLLRQACGIPAARTAPIVVAERVTDLLGLFVIASFGIGVFDYGRWAFAVGLGVVVLAVLVLGQATLMGWLIGLVGGLPVIGKHQAKLEEAYASMRELLRWRVMGVTTAMSVVSWSMEGIAFYWILQALGGETATVFGAMFVFSMTTVLGALSFLPGGLGVTEGSMIGGLLWLGVFEQEARAAGAAYLIRLATLWFGVAIGFIAWLTFRYGRAGDQGEA